MFSTFALLATLTCLLLAVGWLIAGIAGTTFALIMAAVINFITYWYSDRIVLSLYHAKPFENKRIDRIMLGLVKKFRMPKPKVYLVPLDVPNAFATGRDQRHAAVAVTEGLLELSDDELEGVLAHELSHIKNRDMLVATMAATIAGAISYLAQIGYWTMFARDRHNEASLLGLILIIIFAPLAALLVRLAISRGREYKADESAAWFTKKPEALASALKRISEYAKSHPIKGNSATAHLWIVNPFKSDWFTSLFSTHPPIQKRIERLMRMEAK